MQLPLVGSNGKAAPWNTHGTDKGPLVSHGIKNLHAVQYIVTAAYNEPSINNQSRNNT